MAKFKLQLFCQLALLSSAICMPQPTAAQAVVTVRGAEIHGRHEQGVDTFLGIPYAKPPVGELRWRAPEPVSSWQGGHDATRAGAACFQPDAQPFENFTSEFLASGPFSEDCLFLNVWKPARIKAGAPVLVYIHGGAFNSGSGTVPIYNGSKLARQGVVVVTINYRLGVMGFLATPELTRESGRGTSGNYGLLDQIAALHWVQDNIRSFGGDPHRVTIAGQSAGAASVNALILSPLAKGLFQRAIAQSGSGLGTAMPTLADAEHDGTETQRRLGASTLSELRQIPAERLIEATRAVPPSVDGVPAMPRLIFEPNRDAVVLAGDPDAGSAVPQSHVPLLTGFNSNEGVPPPATNVVAAFEAMVLGRYARFSDRLLALYPHANDTEAAQSWRILARDRYMANLIIWARARASVSRSPIYLYEFSHPYPAIAGQPSPGAFHTAEVPFIFGTMDLGERHLSQSDVRTARNMQRTWLNFIRGRSPAALPAKWPAVGSKASMVMGLGEEVKSVPAVSSTARFEVLRDYAESGGQLSLF